MLYRRVILFVTVLSGLNIYSQEIENLPLDSLLIKNKPPHVTKDDFYTLTADEIERMPVRGIDNYLRYFPGVNFQDGLMHIRGGLANSTAFVLNGINITNPLDFSTDVYIIPSAISSLSLSSSGTSVFYGGAASGYIMTELKQGTDDFHFSISTEADKFAAAGSRFLNTYSYRDHFLTVTASGPILKEKIHFFAAAEIEEIGDTQKRFSKGFEFNNVVDQNPYSMDYWNGVSDTVDLKYPDGFTPGNSSKRRALNAVLSAQSGLMKFKLTAAYDWQKLYYSNRPMLNILNNRAQYLERNNFFLNGKFTYSFSPKHFFDINIGFQESFKELKDDYFGGDWKSWSDSTKIAEHTGDEASYRDSWRPSYDYELYGILFSRNGVHLNDYAKSKHNTWHISGKYNISPFKNNLLKAGFSWRTHTYRYFSIDPFIAAHTDLNYVSYGNHLAGGYYSSLDSIPMSRYRDYITVYGYDKFGRENDKGLNDNYSKAVKPNSLSIFVEDKINFRKLSITGGLRYDYIDTKVKTVLALGIFKDPITGEIKQGSVKTKNPSNYISPRIYLSYNFFDSFNLFGNTGRSIIYHPLNAVTNTDYNLGGLYSKYFGYSAPTYYSILESWKKEIGCWGVLFGNYTYSISGYLNSTENIDTNKKSLVNNFDIQGLEINLVAKRFNRIQAAFNYNYSSMDISAYKSDIPSDAGWIKNWDLNYFTEYCGSLSLDYRFGKDDGGLIFEQSGINLIYTFNSGHPYTKLVNTGGQSNAYDSGVVYMTNTLARETVKNSFTPRISNIDLFIDKSFNITDNLKFTAYMRITNLLNTKNVINFYQETGSAADDGYITNPERYMENYQQYGGENYLDLYKALNIENGQSYWDVLGKQLYGHPRQIIFGMKISY